VSEVKGLGWVEWWAFVAALVAFERLVSWMERRGWIYWRGQRQENGRAELHSQALPLSSPTADEGLTLTHIVRRQSRLAWPTVAPNVTCGRALEDLRRTTLPARIECFFVIESDGTLAGIVSTRRLLSADPTTLVSEIMTRDVASLAPTDTMDAALDALLGGVLLAVPVLDGSRRLVGVADIHQVAAECRRWRRCAGG
jgi:hypothetical protein